MIKTVLGIDYGKKRVGIAVGNTLTCHAEPLKIIKRQNDMQVISEIGLLVQEWQVTELTIGIPYHPDDTPHQMTEACLNFLQLLRDSLKLPVFGTDERYSSAIISSQNRHFANKASRDIPKDDAAAAVILQQYLNQLSN